MRQGWALAQIWHNPESGLKLKKGIWGETDGAIFFMAYGDRLRGLWILGVVRPRFNGIEVWHRLK